MSEKIENGCMKDRELKIVDVKLELSPEGDRVEKVALIEEKIPRITWKTKVKETVMGTYKGVETKRNITRFMKIEEIPKEVFALKKLTEKGTVTITQTVYWMKSKNILEEIETYYFLRGDNPFEGLKIEEKPEGIIEEVKAGG